MPMENEKEYFSIAQEIIWGDMDAFNHINNTVYFRYFENVRIAYFEAVGINQLMAKESIGPILGETQCRYLKPLTYPDKITIATWISHLRNKRFTMQYQIFSEKLNSCVAEGSGEIVYLDYKTGKTCAIPQEIRETIIQLEDESKLIVE